jgi:hypothetical protein
MPPSQLSGGVVQTLRVDGHSAAQNMKPSRPYVTSTQFQGTRWLRLALMNPETTVDDIARLLDQLLQLHATE